MLSSWVGRDQNQSLLSLLFGVIEPQSGEGFVQGRRTRKQRRQVRASVLLMLFSSRGCLGARKKRRCGVPVDSSSQQALCASGTRPGWSVPASPPHYR